MLEPLNIGSLFLTLLKGSASRLYSPPALVTETTSIHNLSETATRPNNSALLPLKFEPLPLGSIKPNGWLKDQLELMASGLAGHEYDFYDYISNSNWLGGDKEYSGLNEGFPYWYNGLVPLAYALGDKRLKAQVHNTTQIVFDRQHDDGWLGPEIGWDRNFWGRVPFFLGLIQLAEANATWTEPIVTRLHRFYRLMDSMMKQDYQGYMTPGATEWGRVRMQDMMIVLQWLYDYHPRNQSQLLLDQMQYLQDMALRWEDWYSEENYFGRGFHRDTYTLSDTFPDQHPDYPFMHGVNVGQGLKSPAVVRRWTHNESLVQTAMNGVNWTMTYHGAASGTILADERLVGSSPYSGSELCTHVETMYSLSYLYQALGNNYYADRAELIAFNALPAAITSDHWAHQYVTQPNQPFAKHLSQTPFFNTNGWGNTYGLEPNYPCCTVNHPQGLPKFLSNSWVQVGNNGLAHVLLSPSTINITLKSGTQLNITCKTNYPFQDTFTYYIQSSGDWIWHMRMPSWSIAYRNWTKPNELWDPISGLARMPMPSGTFTWEHDHMSEIITVPRANDTIAIYKGALLYALEIENTNTSTTPKKADGKSSYPENYAPPESKDWEIYNSSAWNYAIDPSTLHYKEEVDDIKHDTPSFASGGAPGYIEVQGCEIDWPLYLNSTPGYPPTGEAKKCIRSERKLLKLVPYGTAKTHMAELPILRT